MTKAASTESKKSEASVLSPEKEQEVHHIIKKYSAIAVSAGFIPVPLLDLAALGGIQLKAIQEIAKVHGKDFSENSGKSAVAAAVTTLSANPISHLGASLLKVIPVIGGPLGTVAFHGYAAASTYAIGTLFHNHFTNGGSILDFNASSAKQTYQYLVSKFKSSDSTVATA